VLDVGALLGSLIGQSQSNVRGALMLADAMSPCVVCCDEIEKALAGATSSRRTDSGVTARVLFAIVLRPSSAVMFMAAAIVVGGATLPAAEPLLAFPGAEGFGRFARGGRGGDVYHVTTLDDSGPGSLREAIASKHPSVPRTVVFDIGGTITLKKPLRIERVTGLTLAGQTAPGGGITVRDHVTEFRACADIVVRYMRFRLGDASKTSDDVLGFGPEEGTCRNVILDHVTATWGVDAIMDVYATDRFTMQWCLFGEALHDSTHSKKEPHAMLMSFRKIRGTISIHHNLLFSSRDRHPTLGGYPPPSSDPASIFDLRNNLIYNWEGPCNLATGRFNIVGNYWRPGPNTKPYEEELPIAPKAEAQNVTTGFIARNVFESKPEWSEDNDLAFEWGVRGGKYIGDVTPEKFKQRAEVVAPADRPVTQSADEVMNLVLERAGASLVRDAADERVIAGVKDRTNRRIDSQDDVGGWPRLDPGTPLPDSDGDGMPDAWEKKHALNPRNPGDGNRVGRGGYTNLERYLDEITRPAATD
jgi:SpoVK/Ycf46/Vps4 family AAA+-type ATPase